MNTEEGRRSPGLARRTPRRGQTGVFRCEIVKATRELEASTLDASIGPRESEDQRKEVLASSKSSLVARGRH